MNDKIVNGQMMMREKILQSLLDFMDEKGSDRLAPKKEMSVEVEQQPEGSSKLSDLLSSKDEPDMPPHEGESEDSDEDRLKALLMGSGDDEDEEDEGSKPLGRR